MPCSVSTKTSLPADHVAILFRQEDEQLHGNTLEFQGPAIAPQRRVTGLALSVARWVHDSAAATFSEAPLSCRTAEFPRSGWKSWHLVRKPSHSPRGSSAGAHTPRPRMVCSQLSSISCVRLRSALCPTTALKMQPPSTQSPFAGCRRYLHQGDVCRLLRGYYSPVMAPTDSFVN